MTLSTELILTTYLAPAISLIAQSRFAQSGVSMTTLLIGAGVLIGLGAVGWVAYQQFNPKNKKDCPKALFRQLCKAHQLDWSEKALLTKLAQRHQLETPAEIFLTPACFEVGDARANQALLQQIDDLKEKLFTVAA